MKKSAFFVLVVLFSWNHAAQAANNCIANSSDIYDKGWTMPSGPYKGQCIDTSIKRPAIILSEDKDRILFANFYYQGEWYLADLPKDAVEEIDFQLVKFPTPFSFITAGHGEIRFKLNPENPLLLISRQSDQLPVRIELKDISFSLQYAAPKGVSYDILQGEFNKYAEAGRLLSTADAAEEIISSKDEVSRQFRLKLSPALSSQVLVNAVHLSQSRGMHVMYNTLGDNCISNAIDVIDAAAKASYPTTVSRFSWSDELSDPLDPVIAAALKALKKRGLVDDQSELETLNAEFAGR